MKIGLKIFFGFIGLLVIVIGLSFAFGWSDVFYTKTVGKAKQDAQREVFEQTQSFVEGKRQELTKYRLEYLRADSLDRRALKMTIVQSFANFDENKLEGELKTFLMDMKYKP